MDIESIRYYGLTKEFSKADYFETENYQTLLSNIKFAIKSGGLIAITGVVGIGKTQTLRRLQQDLRDENKILVSKSIVSTSILSYSLCVPNQIT